MLPSFTAEFPTKSIYYMEKKAHVYVWNLNAMRYAGGRDVKDGLKLVQIDPKRDKSGTF